MIAAIIFSISHVSASVKINYGYSEIFSRDDMDSAIEIITKNFSEVKNIRYTEDDYCNTEKNIEWMNRLAKKRGLNIKFNQCIAFFSDYKSSKEIWTWYFARIKGDDWHLMSFGY